MEENLTRIKRLFAKMDDGSAAIVFAGKAKICSEDENFPFVVNRNFFYLTNIEQDNSVLLLVKGVGEYKTYLFIDEFDELKEKWTGKRLTFDEAKQLSSIANIYPTNEFKSMLGLALAKDNNQYGLISTLYIDHSPELKLKQEYSVKNFIDDLKKQTSTLVIKDIYPLITELRMIKSDYEIEQLKKAISFTNLAIQDLLRNYKVGDYEYELSDRFEYFGKKNGRLELAFSSIVAGGKNAVCLHYPTQNEKLRSGDCMLFDLGLRYNGYNADISRTYPISGKFSEEQKEIYDIVLRCNKAVIEYAHAGLTIKDLQSFTQDFFAQELIRIGLISSREEVIKYYYHNISHHLGIDTHDVSDRDKPLEAGNVITVEPGLYIKERNIGIRIEDDVLITSGKAEVLSKDILKEISDVEKLLESRAR